MDYREFIELAADWSAILTAIVAVGVSALYACDRLKKRWKLEAHLKQEKEKGGGKGQRSIVHLTRNLAMTEADILRAAFSSKRIQPKSKVNEQTGFAEELLLEYK